MTMWVSIADNSGVDGSRKQRGGQQWLGQRQATVWLMEEGNNMGKNMGQSTGTRQWEEAQQAAVSLSTALPLWKGKGLTALPPHPPPFMIIVSPGRLGLTLATGLTAQSLNGLDGLTALAQWA
jgi:hypothetical protein